MPNSKVFRNPNIGPNDPLMERLVPEIKTLKDVMSYSGKKYATKNCYGRRKLIKVWEEKSVVNGETKVLQFPEFGEIEWTSYEKAFKQIQSIAAGVVSFTGLKEGDKIGMYLDTCPEWMLMANACFQQGFQVATCYANLGFEALVYVISQCELTTVICPPDNVPKLEQVRDQIPSLKKIILVGKNTTSSYFEIKNFDELLKCDETVEAANPSKDDIAVIMYTSGSTGMPKGVLLSHGNVVAGCSAVAKAAKLSSADTFLAYLPLAHIFELACEFAFLMVGAEMGYGSPRTLSGKGVGPLNIPMDKRVGDILAFAPTMVAGVPRVWDTIKKGIDELVAGGSWLKKILVSSAFAAKEKAIAKGETTPWWDWLIFDKIKAKFGGRVRLIVSGGAPLSAESHLFLRSVFTCPVVQGYGLTETCAGAAVQKVDPQDFQTREVGEIIECCELKLVDIPEMNYTTNDKPYPRGEVWLRGNHIARGYYKLDDKTKEVFDEEGWFHTGDVGLYDTDRNALRIIDRIKNICKLSHGEYIAFEELEMTYGQSPFVAPNGLCVYADSSKEYAVGLLCLNMPYVKRWAQENNVTLGSDLTKDENLKKAIVESINAIAKSKGKKKWECLPKVAIMDTEFNPDDGTLTASMKLQRRVIYQDRGGKREDEQGNVYFEKGSVLDKLYSK